MTTTPTAALEAALREISEMIYGGQSQAAERMKDIATKALTNQEVGHAS